jgi:3-hydroxybutyryl-CoA dehydrogenase
MDPKEIKRILIVGAGTMGHAIAQVFAQGGIDVNLVDKNQSALERAINLIKSNLTILAEIGRIPQNQISTILNRIQISTNLSDSAQEVDFVLEAVNENPDIKKDVYSQLDKYCPQDIVLASNTSGLNIFSFVEVKNPERLVIHHWFHPPYIIPLVEIVPGPKTSPEIIEFSINLMERLGKKTIVLKEFVESFIVNRIQRVINVQIYEMLAKGWATPEQIDLAIKTSLGIRLPIVGIVQSQDFTGLDLILDIQKLFRTNRRYPQVENLVKQGHLGAKTGKGFYEYGGRSEEEILKKRDKLFLKILDFLEQINAFEPV